MRAKLLRDTSHAPIAGGNEHAERGDTSDNDAAREKRAQTAMLKRRLDR